MANNRALLFSYVCPIIILAMSFFMCKAIDEDRKIHVVYLGSILDNDEVYSPLSHHIGVLEKVVETNSAANILTRSYGRSFSGFAANLTDKERERLADMKGVVSVFPSRTFQPQTTRSWDFIGLNEKIKRNASIESDTIIGVIDTGIWPESESFTDDGFGLPPKKWKGVCAGGKNFTCNNKLIGARFYNSASARDEEGHGTHTASTAAGNAVENVSFYGIAQGTARGGVPSARIAAYKVCGSDGCTTHDILAAFDDAIADGVDIITISLGSQDPTTPLQHDAISIGAFHAMEKGILTANSAGNFGPFDSSVTSVAPWILTAAASNTDRRIIGKVILGNGTTLVGASVNSFRLKGTSFPLIYGKDASTDQCSEAEAMYCQDHCLDNSLVRGKVVLCDEEYGVYEAYCSRAAGSIMRVDWDDDAPITPLPATTLNLKEHNMIKLYMNSTKQPRVNILRSEAIKDVFAPVVASFSSRGPNSVLPDIIKPDISAPGVTILAAFSPVAPITETLEDTRHVKYSVLSGTSMSCPHVAGAAAYIKTLHPDWSPAAIKSSLMTTAWPMNASESTKGAHEFAHGSGHINPIKAVDPGLVYEASKEDYIKLLCLVLDQANVRLIAGGNITCPTGSDKGSVQDHNYPSMAAAVVTPEKPYSFKLHRTVKNVGPANSTYKAKIFANRTQVDIKVVPEVLSFKSLNEKKTFDVTVAGKGLSDNLQSHVSASLVWSDGIHNVRSPIVIYKKH